LYIRSEATVNRKGYELGAKMLDAKARQLKQKHSRERAEIRVLSGPDTDWRFWLLRRYAKVLREKGVLPDHVLMYRRQIEETEVPEPDTRLQPRVVEPSDAEKAELEAKWRT